MDNSNPSTDYLIEQRFTPEQGWLQQVQETPVNTPAEFAGAGALLKEVKGSINRVVLFFAPLKDSAWATHKAIVAKEKGLLEPRQQVAKVIEGKMVAFQQAERRRLEQERQAAEAIAKKAEEDRRIAQAEELEKANMPEAADMVLSAPVQVVVAQQQATKVEGISFRENWRFIIDNPELLPRDYLMPDEKKIGAIVRAMKKNTSIPGVKVFCDTSAATTTK